MMLHTEMAELEQVCNIITYIDIKYIDIKYMLGKGTKNVTGDVRFLLAQAGSKTMIFKR